MTTPVGRRRTWSRWDAPGKRPSVYEAVTHDLHWHVGKEVPFDVAPEVFWNRWTSEHRDGSGLKASSWNGFRDPDALIYLTYVESQDEHEVYLDGLLNEFDELGHDSALAPSWVESLASAYTPSRYLFHALQMGAAYIVQMAPSSYISNAAAFQAADSLRLVQRIAYRTKQLELSHPDAGFGADDRHRWEASSSWQPLRKLVEEVLVVKDWGEFFVRHNLVLKPIVDEAFLRLTAAAARAQDDLLMALMHDDLYQDSLRSRRWSRALVAFAAADNPANADLMAAWAKGRAEEAQSAVLLALEPLLNDTFDSDAAARILADQYDAFWDGLQLKEGNR